MVLAKVGKTAKLKMEIGMITFFEEFIFHTFTRNLKWEIRLILIELLMLKWKYTKNKMCEIWPVNTNMWQVPGKKVNDFGEDDKFLHPVPF
jgi:hypothetical protein